MKNAVLVLLAVLVVAPCLADTTWVTIGSPTFANSIPFWGSNYTAMRFQTLYLQSEINQPGEIVAIGWMTYSDPPANYYDVRVTLCHTGVAALGDTFGKNYDGRQPVQVLAKDTIAIGATSTWYYFPCSFVYNNTDNLLLEIQWRGSAGQSVRFLRNNNQGNIRRVWCYNNDTAAVGQSDAVQGYYARLGFVPLGVAEAEELTPRPALRVEPTLGRSRFSVRLNAVACDIRVIDASGRTAAVLGSGSCTEWDAEAAPAGVYVIQARTATGLLRQQIIKTD